MKNQPIDPKLQEHLRQFKNLEDFRVVVSGLVMEPFYPLGPTKLQSQLTLTPPPPVCSLRWERKEAGGGVTHLQLEMTGGVGDILPTLPQSPHSPQNPPALQPPPHKTHLKNTPRERRQQPRARRRSRQREGKRRA